MRNYMLKGIVFAFLAFNIAAPGFISANTVSMTRLHPTYTVAAGGTNRHTLSFDEHHRIHLRARGNGRSDIDLYVYDHHGNLVSSDSDHTDNCICSFTPEEGETYTIRVINRGHHSNTYELFYEAA